MSVLTSENEYFTFHRIPMFFNTVPLANQKIIILNDVQRMLREFDLLTTLHP